MTTEIYIETERPAKLDSQGVALARDACVLVIDGVRFGFGGNADQAAAAVAKAAAEAAYQLGFDDGHEAGWDGRGDVVEP